MTDLVSYIKTLPSDSKPRHVAIIMDGNGRWAERQGKSRSFGLQEGFRTVRSVINAAKSLSIESLCLFAFSTENWNRPAKEVDFIMSLLMRALKKDLPLLIEHDIKLCIIGERSRFKPSLQKQMLAAEERTKNCHSMTVNLAVNYGGRWDMTQAMQSILEEGQKNALMPSEVDEAYITKKLMMAGQPEVDLMIRTSGEYRISNFILWQAAYAELYFSDLCWPDFNEEAFYKAIIDFAQRQRRFGLTGHQINS
jgi:undecaprenyl diphosphate synthase